MEPLFRLQYPDLDVPTTRAALLADLEAVRTYLAACGLDAIVQSLERTEEHVAGATDAALRQMHGIWSQQLVRLTALAPTRGQA